MTEAARMMAPEKADGNVDNSLDKVPDEVYQ